MSAPVTLLKEGSTGIIELSRPEKFNCLSIAAWTLIQRTLDDFEKQADIQSILIRSQGRHFCTGADLAEVKTVRKNHAELEAFIKVGHDTLSTMERSPLPVVVAVQGLCLAGGLELMLGADVCFASEKAQFGDQHSQFGLLPGWGGSQRLVRLIGLRPAMDLFLSAKWISAKDAQSLGLINYVTTDDNLHSEALSYCQKLNSRSSTGLGLMKKLARQGADLSLPDALRLEQEIAAPHLAGPDVTEGLAAFEENRDPNFD